MIRIQSGCSFSAAILSKPRSVSLQGNPTSSTTATWAKNLSSMAYSSHSKPTLTQFGVADLWVNLGGIGGALALYAVGHWLTSCFNQAEKQVEKEKNNQLDL